MLVRAFALDMQVKNDLTCAFHTASNRAITGYHAGSNFQQDVRLWDLDQGKLIREFKGHKGKVWGLAWKQDGAQILSGSWDNTASLWDANTGECLQVFEGHTGFVRALSANGYRVITASGDRDVRVWNAASGECLQVLRGHTDGAYAALLFDDAQRAVSGSRDGTIRVWDIASGTCTRVIEAHRYHVQSLELSKDQRRILSCSRTTHVWDVETGERLASYDGHIETIRNAAWNSDESGIVTAAHDRRVCVWPDGFTFEGHPNMPVQAAWMPGDKEVISIDEGAQVRVWSVLAGVNG
jgi:WD40 repeat protein